MNDDQTGDKKAMADGIANQTTKSDDWVDEPDLDEILIIFEAHQMTRQKAKALITNKLKQVEVDAKLEELGLVPDSLGPYKSTRYHELSKLKEGLL